MPIHHPWTSSMRPERMNCNNAYFPLHRHRQYRHPGIGIGRRCPSSGGPVRLEEFPVGLARQGRYGSPEPGRRPLGPLESTRLEGGPGRRHVVRAGSRTTADLDSLDAYRGGRPAAGRFCPEAGSTVPNPPAQVDAFVDGKVAAGGRFRAHRRPW